MAKVSDEIKADKIFKVNRGIAIQGYRALIGHRMFEINVEERNELNKYERSGRAKVYDVSIRGKKELVYEGQVTELKNLTDEEIYVLGRAGVLVLNKDLSKQVWEFEKKLIHAGDN